MRCLHEMITGERQPQFGVVYRISKNKIYTGLRIQNILAPDVREAGIMLENTSESGKLEAYQLTGNIATVRSDFPAASKGR